MKVEKKGSTLLVTLTEDDAKKVYSRMCLTKMVGGLLPPGNDVLQDIGYLVAAEVARADKKKEKKP